VPAEGEARQSHQCGGGCREQPQSARPNQQQHEKGADGDVDGMAGRKGRVQCVQQAGRGIRIGVRPHPTHSDLEQMRQQRGAEQLRREIRDADSAQARLSPRQPQGQRSEERQIEQAGTPLRIGVGRRVQPGRFVRTDDAAGEPAVEPARPGQRSQTGQAGRGGGDHPQAGADGIVIGEETGGAGRFGGIHWRRFRIVLRD